jgi:hypothetical protein
MNTDGLFASIMNTPVVGVAIGLMLTYLIASLVASSIKEVVASIFQWRGTYLQKGIEVLLSSTPNQGFDWGGWWKWLIAHLTWMDPTRPATAAAIRALTDPVAEAAAAAARAAASASAVAAAMPNAAAAAGVVANAAATAARTAGDTVRTAANAAAAAPHAAAVALAVADAAETAAAGAVAAVAAATPDLAGTAADAAAAAAAAADTAATKFKLNMTNVLTHPLLKGTPSRLPSYVPSRDFSTALLELLRDGSARPAFSQVEHSVAALPEGDIKRILTAFIREAAGDMDKLRARIETWFDDAMDRLSGIYKRFTQYFLLALGLAIAITLNVDSVHLAIALWDQPDLRAKIAADAQAAIAKPGSDAAGGVDKAMKRLDDLPLPIGRAANTGFYGEPRPPPPAPAGATAPAPQMGVGDIVIGWFISMLPTCRWDFLAILGWLITAFAISLGAPFWFGLLQNVMNLRSSGPPPDRADAKTAANS